MNRITHKDLWEIEEELNTLKFHKVPIGSLLVAHLSLGLLLGWYEKASRVENIKVSLNLYRRKWVSLPNLSKSEEEFQRKWAQNAKKPCIIVHSDKPVIINMMATMAKEVSDPTMLCFHQKLLFEDYRSVLWSELPKIDMGQWRLALKEISKKLDDKLRLFKNRFILKQKAINQLKLAVIEQTQLIMAYEKLLDTLEPSWILSPFDRYSTDSPLILLASNRQIPTFTLMHGEIQNPFGYIPVLADKLFAWGDIQKKILVDHGAKSEKIEVTGAPQFKGKSTVHAESIKTNLGAREEKLIVFGSSAVKEPWRTKAVEGFCEAISSVKDVMGLVKLHPAESKEYYKKLVKDHPSILWSTDYNLSLEDVLSVADLVVLYSSAMAFEALIANIPVVIYNVSDEFIGNMSSYVNGGVPQCTTVMELNTALQAEKFYRINSKTEKFVKEYCVGTKEEAARNILSKINEYTSSNVIVG